MSTELSVFNEMGGVSVNASSALDTLERASIDIQVSTAHHYPRSMTTFKDRAIAIACGDEETGASCLYNRPVGKPGSGKQIFAQGMSVRMAEIVASCYGNLRVGARIIEQTERQVVAQGIAHDLETNFLCTSEVIESTVDKNGEPFTERMRITVAKAALAKARRDAIFQVVPKALAKPVEEAVRRMLYGNQASLTARRERVNLWVTTLGIDKQRVWNAVGVNGADDLTPATMSTLTGLKTAIQSGDVSIDEAFPELESDKPESVLKEKLKNKLKKINSDKQKTPVITTPDNPESNKPEAVKIDPKSPVMNVDYYETAYFLDWAANAKSKENIQEIIHDMDSQIAAGKYPSGKREGTVESIMTIASDLSIDM